MKAAPRRLYEFQAIHNEGEVRSHSEARRICSHIGYEPRRDHSGESLRQIRGGSARLHQRWHYDADSDIAALPAANAFGPTMTHRFNHGNRRISFLLWPSFWG